MKEHLSYQQQVCRLQEHGILIEDEEKALQCLKQINYYRLRGYWLPFWMHHLTGIRNICAHQDRFYGHLVKIKPTLFQEDRDFSNGTQFATMLVLKRICANDLQFHWNKFLSKLINFSEHHKDISLVPMGFPENWKEVLKS